jgi:hypothetical protein
MFTIYFSIFLKSQLCFLILWVNILGLLKFTSNILIFYISCNILCNKVFDNKNIPYY